VDAALDPQLWASLLTLTAMEVVLGIDNLLLLAVLADRLPEHRRALARRLGLLAALGTRLALLLSIAAVMGLTAPAIALPWRSFSWRDIILIAGGFFLVYKGTGEIHRRIEGEEPAAAPRRWRAGLLGTVIQIGLLDLVFSLDSVVTAVGMGNSIAVMVIAVSIAMAVMAAASGTVACFMRNHPTVKMLALSFLLLIGMTLIADGFGAHVPKGYIYAAIGFSAAVELLNQAASWRQRRRVA